MCMVMVVFDCSFTAVLMYIVTCSDDILFFIVVLHYKCVTKHVVARLRLRYCMPYCYRACSSHALQCSKCPWFAAAVLPIIALVAILCASHSLPSCFVKHCTVRIHCRCLVVPSRHIVVVFIFADEYWYCMLTCSV